MTATLAPRQGAGGPGDESHPAPASRGRLHRVWGGQAADPRWARRALWALLAATAVLYLVDLTASGWANAFYSAAVQAGTQSWKAFFFGSSDASNFITVDKTPGSLWFMEISARLFGVNSFAILLPQALMGVASVGVLYATVSRVTGPVSGLLAGAALAVTPVASLMFRFNNPDAMLVLCLVLAGWAITRAIADGRTKWLLWCGAFVGFAFLAKMMQAFLVVPGFGLAYLIAGPHRVAKRLWQLLAALAAMVVAGGWWVAVAMLWPAADRPFIGGSQTNSVWDLMFGYNGVGRLTGDETGSVGWTDQSSATKLFGSEMGGQIAWLLPAAIIAAIVVVVVRGRRPRTDQIRAAVLVWGSWLLVTGITFSLMEGIIHPYYTVALAPAIAALVGIGAATMWKHRSSPIAVGGLAGSVALTGIWAKTLLGRSAGYHPWLGVAVLVAGICGAVVLVLAAVLPRHRASVTVVAVLLSLFAILGGPVAYTLTTVSTGHTGALPTAGPSVQSAGFGGGRTGGFGNAGTGTRPGFGAGTAPTATGLGTRPGGGTGGVGAGGGPMGAGGLLGAPTVTTGMVTLLETDSSAYTWAAAVSGSNNAAGYQLATGLPVMAIGGFNGTDPAPTLARFQQLVQQGRIHYYIAAGLGSSTSGSDAAQEIATWVAAHYTATTVGSQTVYDLSSASS